MYYNFSRSINWSALSSIGNSNVARLTIFMPIIGYMIIFNSTVSDLIRTTLPRHNNTDYGDFWNFLFERNLLFLYFGLLIFGVGVSMYNSFVPRQIRRYPAVEDYISSMQSIGTRNLSIGSFDNIVEMYFRNLKDEEMSSMFSHVNAGFPNDVGGYLHRLIEEMFLSIDAADIEVYSPDGQMESPFYTGTGNLLTENIIEIMYSGRRIDRVLLYAMYEEVSKKSKDVFYIEHKALEYSSPKIRALIFVLYAVGLILTALPSLITSIIIIKNW